MQALENPPRRTAAPSYVITLRHHGIDGREMERTVAIPLEDALFAIPGVQQVVTTSEQGRVRAMVRFSRYMAGTYEAVRDAAQRIYEGLPPQRSGRSLPHRTIPGYPSGLRRYF